MTKLGFHSRLAIVAARAAAFASRATGRGSGGMIGGKIATKIDPQIAANLASHMSVALVTGTNGKSTTTKMLYAALNAYCEQKTQNPGATHTTAAHKDTHRNCVQPAWNSGGDNMTAGITAALLAHPEAQVASLEVDEMYVERVADLVAPQAFILLNLSRDQLDRVGEISTVERRIRTAVNKNPQAIVVANCDDPLIVSAAWDCPHVVWVSAGLAWRSDATSFPRTGTRVYFDDGGGWVVDDTYKRPQPTWWHDDATGEIVTPEGRFPLRLSLPGRANRGNATQAIACAVAMGVPIQTAIAGVETVNEVAGRYARYHIDGKTVRVFLAKNPAGWQEALRTLNTHARSIVLAVNGQVADSQDLSWIWDVDFEALSCQLRSQGQANSDGSENIDRQPRILCSGERASDLAVRLCYAEIESHTEKDPWDAILAAPQGDVEILANYTAFRDLKTRIQREGYEAVEGGDAANEEETHE